jgi:hypothetical protein
MTLVSPYFKIVLYVHATNNTMPAGLIVFGSIKKLYKCKGEKALASHTGNLKIMVAHILLIVGFQKPKSIIKT